MNDILGTRLYAYGFYFITVLCIVSAVVASSTTDIALSLVGAACTTLTGVVIDVESRKEKC